MSVATQGKRRHERESEGEKRVNYIKVSMTTVKNCFKKDFKNGCGYEKQWKVRIGKGENVI